MNTNAPSPAPPQAEPHPAVLLGEAVAGLLMALLAPWGLWRWMPGGRALHAMLTQWGRDFAALMARIAKGPVVPEVVVRRRGREVARRMGAERSESVRPRVRVVDQAPVVVERRVVRPGFPPPPRVLGGVARGAPRPAVPPPRVGAMCGEIVLGWLCSTPRDALLFRAGALRGRRCWRRAVAARGSLCIHAMPPWQGRACIRPRGPFRSG